VLGEGLVAQHSSSQPNNCLLGEILVAQMSPNSFGVNVVSLKPMLMLLATLIMARPLILFMLEELI
jgi:hypothetical protein